jgi:dihydrodipicolinate synthase/N-acetylneuraminate lyase
VDLVLDMCRHCADIGCRAVSITGPYYYRLTQESIEQYFRELAAKSPIDILIYNIPAFANEITVPVLKRLALDFPRIIGTKDTSRDMPRFQTVLHEIKSQRPDFSVLIGWEELLCTSLFMGGDGGTLSSAGVVPEMIMKLHGAAVAGNWEEAKRLQFRLLGLFSLMVGAPNFPEGFRMGYSLRGFEPGRARFPLSGRELQVMEELRGTLACTLAEEGFPEAASACSRGKGLDNAPSRAEVERVVRSVLMKLGS